ncbi:PREDICTED: uncharacterized protein LOC109585778 [Amphimedon queenslandica]|uniref:Uncharacterized protein n=1 Tax=Amphimedon queenslandica TaxID=400682 RepID=A0AAN0JL61_AMPQE|nr:PREDICTED: uncharacterized protein LOC109585778 [Amphimedon queenslandica]|eukprot:XP_019857460.1 PREDICTED: uncharacterized protein LOC109585778 [Amphimedon queenslandica]
MARLVFLAALAVLLPVAVFGAQCAQSEESMCVFTCNGTMFNLTDVFKYPVTIADDSRGYNYEWNPCEYQACKDEIEPGEDCAICQKADRYYNCGHIQQAVFLMQQYTPFMWKIQYLWGTDWRMTEFTFLVDKNRDIPTVTFTGEDPYLQYNFFVTGKCIGQPYCNYGMPDPFKTASGKGLKPSPTPDL